MEEVFRFFANRERQEKGPFSGTISKNSIDASVIFDNPLCAQKSKIRSAPPVVVTYDTQWSFDPGQKRVVGNVKQTNDWMPSHDDKT